MEKASDRMEAACFDSVTEMKGGNPVAGTSVHVYGYDKKGDGGNTFHVSAPRLSEYSKECNWGHCYYTYDAGSVYSYKEENNILLSAR